MVTHVLDPRLWATCCNNPYRDSMGDSIAASDYCVGTLGDAGDYSIHCATCFTARSIVK